ncbi:MAG: TolC family protein [Acidobacteriaceae bacterium]|nr:TolC family protein [Acidobacteriaceae bacterium]MBV9499355.1 TolC family protein [Acidobacteriaceae bacterium]
MKPTGFMLFVLATICGFVCLAPESGYGQMPGPSGSPSSRAVPLPASGRTNQVGAVLSQESASPNGAETVSGSIQVSGDYTGSVPAKDLPPGPITVSLAGAVQRGLATNLGAISANNSVAASRAQRIQELSALLPNLSASASETVTQINLAAYGFQFKLPPGVNFSIPSVVGPFSYSQLQGSLSQSIYDPVQRRNWNASKETERAAVLSARDARELITLAVGGTYLQTLASAAAVESQQAQVDNAQAVYNQAVTRKAAGTNAKIDVMRSLVELETQRQRLSAVQADLRKQKIALARTIGLPLDRELVLSEVLAFNAHSVPDTAAAIERAFQYRSDLRAAEAQVRAAELALSAARAERWPSASVNGYYGVLGPTPASTHGVFAVTGAVNVPIWEGNRIKGDIQEAETTLRQRQAELADQRGKVEQDVRTALIELETAIGQVEVAENNRSYARETLNEARDRFSAGVATTVEVVQAQEQVASTESSYISSLFSFNLAKLSLARATGDAANDLPDLLKETRP